LLLLLSLLLLPSLLPCRVRAAHQRLHEQGDDRGSLAAPAGCVALCAPASAPTYCAAASAAAACAVLIALHKRKRTERCCKVVRSRGSGLVAAAAAAAAAAAPQHALLRDQARHQVVQGFLLDGQAQSACVQV